MMCPSGFTSRFSDSGGIYLNQMASPSLADQIQNEFRDNAVSCVYRVYQLNPPDIEKVSMCWKIQHKYCTNTA